MEQLVPFLLFAFVVSITPGPNNIMLLASGVNFGFQRTIPHFAGVLFGLFSLFLLLGGGFAFIFQNYPVLHTVLRWCGALYILYIALRIVNSGAMQMREDKRRPLSFFEAVLFQYFNVKAWTVAAAAIALFSNFGGFAFWNALYVSSIFAVIVAPCLLLWAFFGVFLSRYLQSPNILTIFNWAVAGLLVLSIGLMFL